MASASPRRAPDTLQNQVDVGFNYPNDPNLPGATATLAPNSRVFVSIQIGNGQWRQYPLTAGAAGDFSRTLKMSDGSSFIYKYVVKTPGSGGKWEEQWEPPGDEKTNLFGVAEEVPELNPSPRAPIENVRKTVEGGVKRLLEVGTTRADAAGFPLRLRTFQRELETRLGISTDITPLVLGACAKAIRDNKKYPAAIRDLFPENSEPADFDELEQRLEEGAAVYREAVFMKLLENADARKEFKLAENAPYDDANPFGKDATDAPKNDLFRQYCNARCLSGIGPALKDTLGAVASSPRTDPTTITNMNKLMADVASRLPPEAKDQMLKDVLDNVPEDMAKTVLDVLVNAGITASLFFAPGAALLAAAAKGGLEGLTGMKLVDLLRLRRSGGGREIGALLLQNNLLMDPITTAKGKRKEAFKARLWETLGRALPVANLFFGHRDVTSHGMYKAPIPGKAEAKPIAASRESFMKKACDEAAKE